MVVMYITTRVLLINNVNGCVLICTSFEHLHVSYIHTLFGLRGNGYQMMGVPLLMTVYNQINIKRKWKFKVSTLL